MLNTSPDFKNTIQSGTVDTELGQLNQVSQIELQGGYGGGGFIEYLGYHLNNFCKKFSKN